MTDREAPTPRLTGLWQIHEQHAHDVSERLRAHARVEPEAQRSRLLRDLSDVAESYARVFRRWSTEDVAATDKMRSRGQRGRCSRRPQSRR